MGNNIPVKNLDKITTFVGLDLSVRSTGWCVERGSAGNIETGTIGTLLDTKKSPLLDHDRFLKPYDTFSKIRKWIQEEDFNPRNTIFVVEDFIGSGNGSRSVVDLSELGGMVKGYLVDHKYKFFLVSPGTWKKFIFRGDMRKPKRKSEPYIAGVKVYEKYHYEFDTTDEVDAFALVKFIRVVLKLETALDAQQKTVTAKFLHEYINGKPPKKVKKRKKKNVKFERINN